MLRALRPRGTYEAHIAALRSAFDEDPIAAVAILGALAAPLLSPLDAPNFAIHFPGRVVARQNVDRQDRRERLRQSKLGTVDRFLEQYGNRYGATRGDANGSPPMLRRGRRRR